MESDNQNSNFNNNQNSSTIKETESFYYNRKSITLSGNLNLEIFNKSFMDMILKNESKI